ncbi:hypothetical protein APHAL10511_008726 [Amanita phalloides]|nr:hypothetical protein APHAL10511_008726 [Amanita phalloides]
MSPPSQPANNVVGSPADKRLTADSTDDYNWSKCARSYYWSCTTASTSASTQKDSKGGGGFMSLGKSLTRKVSSRWHKVGGAIAAEGGPSNTSAIPPAAQDSEKGCIQRSGSAGTEETQAKSALEVNKERIKKIRSRYSMRISVDRDLKPLADMHTPGPVSPAPSTPTPSTPTSLDRGRVPRRLVKPRPPASSADPSPSSPGPSASLSASASAPSSEKAGNGKLWKLMKRISTGGLRDKYRSYSPSTKQHLSNYSEESLSHTSTSTHGPPPPVPALPKSFQSLLPGSPPASLTSSFSEGGQGQRTADISHSAQVNANQNRIVDKDRSVSSPLPTESRQKKMTQCIRPISSVGILKRQRSTSNGLAASSSTSANVSRPPLTRTTTPSGQTKPKLPSRPSTARSSSPVPSESTRFLGSSLFGRSRSIRSRRSSISSLDEANGQHIHHYHLPLHNHLQPNHHLHALHKQQQQQQNNNNNNGNNGLVSVPPVPTNILAKHILPPGALMKEEVKMGAENENGRRRNEKKESISTGAGAGASLTAQSGSGSTHGNGVSSTEASAGHGGGPPYTKGATEARRIDLPLRSAVPPPPPSGATGSGRNPPSPGQRTSIGGDEWSIAQSPEYELPSLPFPPRRRGVSEKAKRDDDVVDGGGGDAKMLGRSRSSTVAVSPVSSPSLSRVPSMSYLSKVGEAEENVTPVLSTFGRVVGKQFGMERMENPSSVSVSDSVSSLGSTSAGSSLDSRSELSLHGRMSIYGSISRKTRQYLSLSPGIGKSSASAVSRSYSLPSSPDMPIPSPAILLPSQSQPSGSGLSLSSSLSSSSAAPARPARDPRRPSVSPNLRVEGTVEEKEQSSNRNGSGKLLRKTSVGERRRPMLSNGGSTTSVCSPRNTDHDAHSSSHLKSSESKLPHPLTEREKREKWEDLLERSDRAGGTIHLSADGEGLLSDRMLARISAVSLATTVGTQEEREGGVPHEGE